MCGIAGFERGSGDAEITGRLQGALANRGPDGAWAEDAGRYSLVQTRLAVIDLSDSVRYPLSNETGTVQLVFNGEIYGYRALRDELVRRGHRFKTDCDAEVVVHAFEEWDIDAFGRLNGMFALAIHDGRDGRLVLARDRFGVKPLVHTTMGRFAFASDAMALVAAGLSPGEIDPAAISELVTLHFLRPPATGILGLTQLRPGAVGVRNGDGSWSSRPFVEPLIEGSLGGSEALERAGAAIDSAVRRQLVADVEVGLLLSSGIDSALLLDASVRAGARPRVFTIAFAGAGDYDESRGAAELAALYGVPHEIENFDAGFVDAVEGVAAAFDQPFADSSAIATLQLAKLASAACTVVLSGTGADELFGGYYRLRAHKLRRALAAAKPITGRLASRGTLGNERASVRGRFLSYADRLARSDSTDDDTQYLSLVGSATSPGALALFRGQPDPSAERSRLRRELAHDADREGYGRLRRLQHIELSDYLPGDVLVKEDRASMAVGLEARVPLLDEEVAATAFSIAAAEHISVREGKGVLRRLAASRLPASTVATRAKRGFAVPLAGLFGSCWRNEASDWFQATESDLVDGPRCARALDSGCLTGSDLWLAAAVAAWEARLRHVRTAAGRQP